MIKICEYCKIEFKTLRKNQKYCSKSCGCKSKYTPDNSIFENGLNKINAYILGFIYADGCLYYSKHTKRYRITISSKDYDLISNIHSLMTPKKKLYRDGQNYQVVTSNEIDINFIKDLGVQERKTYNLTFPNIEEKYYSHFIRGFFDGDGCIYNSKTYTQKKEYIYKYISICCTSLEFLKYIQRILKEKEIYSKINVDNRKKVPIYLLEIKRKNDVIKFYKYLYKDATLYLERKKDKFTDVI